MTRQLLACARAAIVTARADRACGGTAGHHTAPLGAPVVSRPAAGLALVTVSGAIVFNPSLLDLLNGEAGVDYRLLADALDQCRADASLRRVAIEFDSPGGSLHGISDAATAIARLRAAGIRVTALAHEACYSAAYWLACGCDEIVATPSANVGSIGVYGVVTDSSAAAAAAGVRVTVIGYGETKGSLLDGVPVTDADLAEVARELKPVYDDFINAVAAGRRVPHATAAAWADGRSRSAAEALRMGLIDAVEPFADTIARLSRAADAPAPRTAAPQPAARATPRAASRPHATRAPGAPRMSATAEAPPAAIATLDDLEAAYPELLRQYADKVRAEAAPADEDDDETTPADPAARATALSDALGPGSEALVVRALRENMTVAKAQTIRLGELAARIAALEANRPHAAAPAPQRLATGATVAPPFVPSANATAADPEANMTDNQKAVFRFHVAAAKAAREKKLSLPKAVAAAKANPAVGPAYLAAVRAGTPCSLARSATLDPAAIAADAA